MTQFRDYQEVALQDFLTLPIKGVEYVIQPVGAADGIRLALALTDDAGEHDLTDEEFRALLLGDQLPRMRADNVPEVAILRATMTALADHREGRAAAVAFWETNAVPERLAAYMAAKKSSEASTPSPSTESANPIPSPASTTPTTSPPATPPAKSAPNRGQSAGRKSSGSGRSSKRTSPASTRSG